jgi:uncharacterized membrane protein
MGRFLFWLVSSIYLLLFVVLLLFETTGIFKTEFMMNYGYSALILFSGLTTFLLLKRDVSYKTAILITATLLVFSFVIQWIALKTDYPFGSFMYTENLSSQIFDLIPWAVPILWFVMIVNAYVIASVLFTRKIGERIDSQTLIVAVTALVVTLMDLNLEPVAVNVKQFWFWLERDWAYYGIPRINFFGWLCISLLLSALLILWFSPHKFKISTAWYSLLVLTVMQTLWAVLNWQAGQYIGTFVGLNTLGLLAVGLLFVSESN